MSAVIPAMRLAKKPSRRPRSAVAFRILFARPGLGRRPGWAEVAESRGSRPGLGEAVDDRRNPRPAVQQQRVEEADRNDLAEQARDDRESVFPVQDPPDRRPCQLYRDEDPEDFVRDGAERAEPGRADGLVVPDDVVEDRGAHGSLPGGRWHPGCLWTDALGRRRHALRCRPSSRVPPRIQALRCSSRSPPCRTGTIRTVRSTASTTRQFGLGWRLVPDRADPLPSRAESARQLHRPRSRCVLRRKRVGLQRLERFPGTASAHAAASVARATRASARARIPSTLSAGSEYWSSAGWRLPVPVPDPLLLRRHALGVAVREVGHVDVLGVDLGHHELAELGELLDLFGREHVPDLDGLHAALALSPRAVSVWMRRWSSAKSSAWRRTVASVPRRVSSVVRVHWS